MCIQPDEWQDNTSDFPSLFHFRLRIEQLNLRVATTLGSRPSDRGLEASIQDRSTLYRVLNFELRELELGVSDESCERPQSVYCGPSAIANALSGFALWYVSSARLHLHAFYLLEDATSPEYTSRVATLYSTASSLINMTLAHDSLPMHFLAYSPFSCYQSFICAAFCILRIATNVFFQAIVDTEAGNRLLEGAIVALRETSLVNNDLPARLGDVLAFLCALPDPSIIGGQTVNDMPLRQTRNRLSMSVVYDCLWTWRRQFRADANGGDGIIDAAFDTDDKSPMRKRCSISEQHSNGRKLMKLAVHAFSSYPKTFRAF